MAETLSFIDAFLELRIDFVIFTVFFIFLLLFIQLLMRKFQKEPIPFWMCMFLISLIFLAGFFAELAGERERTHLKRMIEGFAPTYAYQLEKEGHAEVGLENSSAETDLIYQHLILEETRWINLNPSINDIYTFRKMPDGKVVFIVDAETDYDRNGKYEGARESRTQIGEAFTTIGDEAVEIVFSGKPFFDAKPYTDRWGTWISAYAPMFDKSGRVEAAVGVDYAAEDWVRAIALQRLGALSLVAIPILILMAFSIMLNLIKASETRFRSLISNIPGATYRFLSSSNGFEFFSPQIHDITGYAAAYFTSKPYSSFEEMIYVEDRQRFRETLQAALLKKEPYDLEYRITAQNGETRWISEKGRGLYDPKSEKFLCRDGTIFDMTRRKQLEENLFKARKFEAIGQLAGGIAHDFNNLLTIINCEAEMQMLKFSEGDPERQDFAEIVKAGKRAAWLTDRLLAYAGRQMKEPSLFEINDFLTNLKDSLSHLCGVNVRLGYHLMKEAGWVRINPGQMEHLLANLLNNSCEAMPDGGSVFIETRSFQYAPSRTEPQGEIKPGEYVVVLVHDNGPGVPEEIKEHIFEPFYSTKNTTRSSGMGLAMAYGIMKQNDGYIRLQSRPGAGTRVELYFPKREAGISKKTEDEKDLKTPKSETVLVVDDEPMVLKLACNILKRSGYRVLSAQSGEEALKVAGTEPKNGIQLLFTDVMMPRLGGRRLADVLKKERPEIKILFSSGYTLGELEETGALETNVLFFQKPYSPVSLVGRVREILNGNKT